VSDLSSDRIVNALILSLSLSLSLSCERERDAQGVHHETFPPRAVAVRCSTRVRKYPAGRRPTSQFSARRFARGPPRTYRQVFMDRHSRIYWYRAYFTRYLGSYSLHPNNMPATAQRTRTLLPSIVSFVSTANIYGVTP